MAAALPAVLPIAGSLIGKLVGGKQKTQAAVPGDLQGTRQNQIGLMNYLLGFGGPPAGLQGQGSGFGNVGQAVGQFAQNHQQGMNGPAGATQPGFGQQQPLNFGGPVSQTGSPNFGGFIPNIGPGMQPGGSGGMQQYTGGMQNMMAGGQTPQQGPGNGGLLDDRLQSYFGNLGVNQSGLQNQATAGISRYLNQQSPEQRALEAAHPFLQNIGGTAPGSLGGFYNNAINNPNAAGPGQDVEGFLGGLLGQGGQQNGLANQLQSVLGQMLSGGGGYQSDPAAAMSNSVLGKMAQNNPGQGVVDALQPHFQRNLAEANQEGTRFGSANAVLRSRALDDFNLLAQQALQQGVDQQIKAATAMGQGGGGRGGSGPMDAVQAAMQFLGQQQNAAGQLGNFRQQGFGQQLQGANQYGNLGLGGLGLYGQLAGQQGQNEFQRLLGGFGAGEQISGQNDLETQRRLNLIQGLMGGAQGAAFNVPITQTPGGAAQGGAFGGGLAQLMMQGGWNPGGHGQQQPQQGGGVDLASIIGSMTPQVKVTPGQGGFDWTKLLGPGGMSV